MNLEKKDIEFLEMIVKNIVTHEDDVRVEDEIDDRGIKLTLFVNKEDKGKVIGSGGKMATSIRTIMHGYGGKMDKRISVLIDDSDK